MIAATIPAAHVKQSVTIGTYLSELAPKHMRDRVFACCGAVGWLAVPVVAFLYYRLVPRALLGLDDWRWVMLIGARGARSVWWIRRTLPGSPRWLGQKGRLVEADHIMTVLEARTQTEHGRLLPPAETPEPVIPHGRFGEM